MSSTLTLALSLSLLGQLPRDVLWRDGAIEVKRFHDFDPKGGRSERTSLMIDGVHFGFVATTHDEPNPLRRKPTSYYHRDGPVGGILTSSDAFAKTPFASDACVPTRLLGLAGGAEGSLAAACSLWSEPPIGVVGLHVGTIACYAKPYQTIDFYERNPIVTRLSRQIVNDGSPYFWNLVDAHGRGGLVSVKSGEPRKLIQSEAPKGFYKYLFVEMCQRIRLEDVEVELITKEGLQACVDALRTDGVVCFHVSSRFVNSGAVIANSAKALGLAAYHVSDDFHGAGKRPIEVDRDRFSSEWVIVGRDPAGLKALADALKSDAIVCSPQPKEKYDHTWTDKGAKPLAGLMREDPRMSRAAYAIVDWVYWFPMIGWQTRSDMAANVHAYFRTLSRQSLAALEKNGTTAEWLRKGK